MSCRLPVELVANVAGYLDCLDDLVHLEASFGPKLPGVYAALAGGRVAQALAPLVPAVREVVARGRSGLVSTQFLRQPDWELRLMLHHGVPHDVLHATSLEQLEKVYADLAPCPVVAGSVLHVQLPSYCDGLYAKMLWLFARSFARVYMVGCLQHQPLGQQFVDTLRAGVHAVASRMTSAGVDRCLRAVDEAEGLVAPAVYQDATYRQRRDMMAEAVASRPHILHRLDVANAAVEQEQEWLGQRSRRTEEMLQRRAYSGSFVSYGEPPIFSSWLESTYGSLR